MRVLLVIESASAWGPIREALVARGHTVDGADAAPAGAALEPRLATADLIVADVELATRLELEAMIARTSPGAELVLVGPRPATTSPDVLEHLPRPFDPDRFLAIVDEVADIVEGERLRAPVDLVAYETVFAGDSPAIRDLHRRVRLVARSEAPVWIFGEDGSGRGVVARAIHDRSARRREAYVAVNTAAHADDELSRLLFRGDGALVQRARAGTLFLDRISGTGPTTQRELVRYLEALPGGQPSPRLLVGIERSATTDGQAGLSPDLYFRLKVLEVEIPALQERLRDLAPIAERMLRRLATDPPAIAPPALAQMERYRFPGNLLELAHALTHALILARGGPIEPAHLPSSIAQSAEAHPGNGANDANASELESLDIVTKRFERLYLLRVLRVVGGNRGRAAEILGLSRKGLWGKLKAHGISDDDIDQDAG